MSTPQTYEVKRNIYYRVVRMNGTPALFWNFRTEREAWEAAFDLSNERFSYKVAIHVE